MRFFTVILLGVFAISAFSPLPVSAEKLSRTVEFETPDIKDAFCGARIDFRICKCAFHNEMCKDIGRTSSIADFILNSKYEAHVAQLRAVLRVRNQRLVEALRQLTDQGKIHRLEHGYVRS